MTVNDAQLNVSRKPVPAMWHVTRVTSRVTWRARGGRENSEKVWHVSVALNLTELCPFKVLRLENVSRGGHMTRDTSRVTWRARRGRENSEKVCHVSVALNLTELCPFKVLGLENVSRGGPMTRDTCHVACHVAGTWRSWEFRKGMARLCSLKFDRVMPV